MLTGAHFHLLVNHAPVFGAFFALALLLASFIWSPDTLRRTGFVVLIGTGLAAAASDLSGDPAEHAIRGLPGVTRAAIHAHESFAGTSLVVAGIVAVIALALLVRARRTAVSSGAAAIALVGSLIVTGMMSYTALLGGRIRHTEVRPGATAADAAAVEAAPQRPPQ